MISRANEVFDYEKRLADELRLIESDQLNSDILKKYSAYSIAEGISLARVSKRICQLRLTSKLLNRKFEDATKDDIVELIAKIERRDYSLWTKRDFKLILRQFYGWLKNCPKGTFPPEVAWIKLPRKILSDVQKQDLLTWEEVQKMVNLTRNSRDRAFIQVLFDSGMRISEMLPLRIGDVELDETGGVLHADGKTGKAPGIIGWSAPALSTWLNQHPFKENSDAPLWCVLGKTEPKMLTYASSGSMIKNYARKAGITKRVWHHLFKHSAATRDSKKLPTALMNLKYHWKQNSEMPSFYVHLSEEDVKEVREILYGQAKSKVENDVSFQKCPRCSFPLSPDSSYCNRCGLAIGAKESVDRVRSRKLVDEMMEGIMKDPEKRKKFLELMGGS